MSLCPSWQTTMARLLFLPVIALCALAINGSLAVYGAQQQSQPRDITSEDFSQNRSSINPSSRPASPHARKRRYHLVSTQAAAKAPVGSSLEQVGITIWRLRASTAADGGPKIPVHEGGGTTWWTPERTQAGTLFKVGDRVRLSIESPRAGYLYVIDREQYSDGTLGDPLLIFPTLLARGGDNRVGAGVLVEIPAQEDNPPYFNLVPRRADLVGDLLTVLVTPQPIEGITITKKQFKLSIDQMAQWEKMWGTQVELFEMEGGAGASWTKEEQRAGTVTGRSLTQDEPTPQTIYRVRVKPGSPLLVTVPLGYGRINRPE